ncbi:UDP-GlcNAc--UDP-phosphate GlcNAc-1-phosphate transferase [Polaribacter sp. ALD11]|uniref:MraY family glycosyltransferase n=1 Tax=Polaribacter sp. ALD11 TaxID=2058137 RepID=UPI000C311470|nr:glycosyltransferase family 4 protein [Polaribacter sp. ALD11]AUC85229.1 UDP-GlcNAc--UDP-phosphate GlcNAc-1-phosphate transferase [Polaribacter sp. ALD11]
MNTYILVLLILIVASYIYLKLAIKFKIIDKPNERSSHTKITVRGGGIIFPIAILLFFFFNDYQYLYFVLGVFIISIVSFLDDMYTLSSKIRFPFQVIAVCLILYEVGLPFSPIYLFAISLIIGVFFVNMFNFMDGINGITGFYSLAVISGLYFINLNEQIVSSELIIYVFISILIFGFYNFRKKAIFFAGDIGSISIGMLIFFIGLYLTIQLSSPLIVLLVIVYGADSANTLLYRKFFTKESIFEAHRHHIYQKLVDVKKISHLKVAVLYAVIQLIVNLIIYKTYRLDLQIQLLVLVVLVSIFITGYIYLFKKLKA